MTDDCPILYNLQGELLRIGNDEKTDESLNPKEEIRLQNELSLHLVSCEHPQCRNSFAARVRIGLQDKEGHYLKYVKTNTDRTDFEEDMIVCPHCKGIIVFDIELCDGRTVEIRHIGKGTTTEMNMENDGR